jgi:hypothetical protein
MSTAQSLSTERVEVAATVQATAAVSPASRVMLLADDLLGPCSLRGRRDV